MHGFSGFNFGTGSGRSPPSDGGGSRVRIKLIGIGGGGCNSLERIRLLGLRHVTTAAINTDEQHLSFISADEKHLIGKRLTKGFGCGGKVDLARRAAEEDRESIVKAVSGADVVYIAVGLGGGTGSGAAAIVAEEARKTGALVMCMAFVPFKAEGQLRIRNARQAAIELEQHCHSLILLRNDMLLQGHPAMPLSQSFCVVDQFIVNVVRGMTETLDSPSVINLDYASVRSLLQDGGTATVIFGENDASRPDLIVSEALNHPLTRLELAKAKGAMVHITGGPRMSLERVNAIMEGVTSKMNPDANIIMGTRVDDSYSHTIRLMAIITGVSPAAAFFDAVHPPIKPIPLDMPTLKAPDA